jgi:hypothetical protein
MKREEDPQLWDLLGQARPVEVSSFFARDVVRKIRQRPARFELFRSWLRPAVLIPATSLAVAVVVAMLTIHRPAPVTPAENVPDVIASIDPQDYDVIADLDQLTAADDNNLWDDDTQTL